MMVAYVIGKKDYDQSLNKYKEINENQAFLSIDIEYKITMKLFITDF